MFLACITYMSGSRKFFQRGSNFDGFLISFLLVDDGREGTNTSIAGHHRPASETPFKWRFASGLMVVTQL